MAVSKSSRETARRIIKERDWWKALAEAYGMRLYGFNGMPPASGTFYRKHEITGFGETIDVSGPLAEAMFKMAQKAGLL